MTERKATGLYDPAFERDSCGFGLIANLDDLPSHWVVETAISALARLTHRGAVAADGKTGDGCGLLIKFPESFMRSVAEELGFGLAGRFAAGTVFLGQDGAVAAEARRTIDAAAQTDAEFVLALGADTDVTALGPLPERVNVASYLPRGAAERPDAAAVVAAAAAGLPRSEAFAANCFSLPLFPDLTEAQVDQVCAALSKLLAYYRR